MYKRPPNLACQRWRRCDATPAVVLRCLALPDNKDHMKLTANEIRDVLRHLEAGRPLPDHYRFLLFDDKREVELVWNGKTNEVCNSVLPFQVIEQVDEPRAEKPADTALQAGLFDSRGRQLKAGPTSSSGATTSSSSPPSRTALSATKSKSRAASSSSISIRPSMSAPIFPWTSKSATKPSPKSPTSSKKSPTATLGAGAQIRSLR